MSNDHTEGGASGTGTETLNPTGSPHLDARKAIFARAASLNQAERELDIETVPGAAQMQDGYDRAGDAHTDDGDAGDTAMQPAREYAGEIDQGGVHAQETVLDSAEVAPDPAATPEMVTLKVFGKEVIRPRAEVDAAGGADALQTRLASEERFRQADHLAKLAERLAIDAATKQREYDEKSRNLNGAPQSAPATTGNARPNSVPTAPPNPAPAAHVDLAAAQKAVEGLWSGDPEVASKALADVLATRQTGASVDPAEIASLVVAKVRADLAAEQAKGAQKQQVLAVNDLMRSDRYKPIMEDQGLKADTKALFDAALRDPMNTGRSMVTIADEVATRMLGRIGAAPAAQVAQADVQAQVEARTHMKRRIPQPSGASERAPSSQQESAFPTKANDIVNMLRAARGQPPQ